MASRWTIDPFWKQLQPFQAPLWTQLHQLQHEMNRLFDRWAPETNGGAASYSGSFPPVNVWEDADPDNVVLLAAKKEYGALPALQ